MGVYPQVGLDYQGVQLNVQYSMIDLMCKSWQFYTYGDLNQTVSSPNEFVIVTLCVFTSKIYFILKIIIFLLGFPKDLLFHKWRRRFQMPLIDPKKVFLIVRLLQIV